MWWLDVDVNVNHQVIYRSIDIRRQEEREERETKWTNPSLSLFLFPSLTSPPFKGVYKMNSNRRSCIQNSFSSHSRRRRHRPRRITPIPWHEHQRANRWTPKKLKWPKPSWRNWNRFYPRWNKNQNHLRSKSWWKPFITFDNWKINCSIVFKWTFLVSELWNGAYPISMSALFLSSGQSLTSLSDLSCSSIDTTLPVVPFQDIGNSSHWFLVHSSFTLSLVFYQYEFFISLFIYER